MVTVRDAFTGFSVDDVGAAREFYGTALGLTATVAAELLEAGIILNTINPGPVNTGYLDPETTDRPLDEVQELLASTPFGRYGRPEDAAELIGWLCTDAGAWIVGQVLTSDGGFGLA